MCGLRNWRRLSTIADAWLGPPSPANPAGLEKMHDSTPPRSHQWNGALVASSRIDSGLNRILKSMYIDTKDSPLSRQASSEYLLTYGALTLAAIEGWGRQGPANRNGKRNERSCFGQGKRGRRLQDKPGERLFPAGQRLRITRNLAPARARR